MFDKFISNVYKDFFKAWIKIYENKIILKRETEQKTIGLDIPFFFCFNLVSPRHEFKNHI